MIRTDTFKISQRPYGIDMSHVQRRLPDAGYDTPWVVDAVWFRRRRGVLVACIGQLWDWCHDNPPATARDFLDRCTTGRYGADCLGRWDGTGYWGSELPGEQDRHLTVLRPMLANFPAIPPGYDGWWHFQGRSQS